MTMTIPKQVPQWRGNYDLGYVGFTVTKGSFVSAGISWFSRFDDMPHVPAPTHCFVFKSENETVEAFANGVKVGTLNQYLDDPNVRVLVRRPREYTRELGGRIVAESETHLGHRYGYVLIAALAVSNSVIGRLLSVVTRGWFTRAVTRVADSKSQEVCSELVAMAMQAQPELKLRGVLANPARTIKPVDLFVCPYAFEPPDYSVELTHENQRPVPGSQLDSEVPVE
jgi:hypothetical protein